jgi:hypothetical protein
MTAKTGSAATSVHGIPLGHNEVHGYEHILVGNTSVREPNTWFSVTAAPLLQNETCGPHCSFELRRSVEEGRVKREIAIRCVRSNREIPGARMEIDGLSAGDDQSITL